MSTKHVRSGADVVRFVASVRIDCGACGASRTLSGPEFVCVCGTGTLASVKTCLKCSRCDCKAVQLIVLPPV
jgi:hypothetical protein